MNTQLQRIYNEKWNTFSIKLNEVLQDNLKENKPTNPLLLYINEEKYQNADIKIMIFGQEIKKLKQFGIMLSKWVILAEIKIIPLNISTTSKKNISI